MPWFKLWGNYLTWRLQHVKNKFIWNSSACTDNYYEREQKFTVQKQRKCALCLCKCILLTFCICVINKRKQRMKQCVCHPFPATPYSFFLSYRLSTPTLSTLKLSFLDKNISPLLVYTPTPTTTTTSISATALGDLTSQDPSREPPTRSFAVMDGAYLWRTYLLCVTLYKPKHCSIKTETWVIISWYLAPNTSGCWLFVPFFLNKLIIDRLTVY